MHDGLFKLPDARKDEARIVAIGTCNKEANHCQDDEHHGRGDHPPSRRTSAGGQNMLWMSAWQQWKRRITLNRPIGREQLRGLAT